MSKKSHHILNFLSNRKTNSTSDLELVVILYALHYEELIKYVSRFLNENDVVETQDVVAETFTRALENKNSLQELEDPKYWLFAIAKNICKEIASARRDSQPLDEIEELNIPNDDNSDLFYHIKELEGLIVEAKQMMSNRQRQFFRDLWREDLSVGEIAERYQVTQQHVSNQLVIARKLIREHLEKHAIFLKRLK